MAIVLVQKCPAAGITGGNNAGTTVAGAFGSNNTVHNLLVILGQRDITSGTLSISDTLGNAYTPIFNTVAPGGGHTASIWVCYDCKAGANTITITSSVSTSNLWVGGGEYSGLATSSGLDQSGSGTQGTLSSAPAVNTTQANELLLGFLLGGTGGTAPTVGTGYTIRGSTNNGDGSPGWEDQIVSATGSYIATFATGDAATTAYIITLMTLSIGTTITGSATIAY